MSSAVPIDKKGSAPLCVETIDSKSAKAARRRKPQQGSADCNRCDYESLKSAAGPFVFEKMASRAATSLVSQGPSNGPALNVLSSLLDSPDLHVILLGTGTPIIVEGRSGPCTAVVGGGDFYLVDVGPGTFRQVSLLGLPIGRLTAVILTHYHSDHIGDLGELMTFSWIAGRKGPLPVYGPEGILKVVQGFKMAYELDGSYRTEHHKPMLDPKNHGFEPVVLDEIPDGCETVQFLPTLSAGGTTRSSESHSHHTSSAGGGGGGGGGIKVFAFEVDHLPVTPAYGYRFELGDRVCVVSGDTKKCASLVSAARGAHVLVQEAICCDYTLRISKIMESSGLAFQAKLFDDITGYHTSVQDCVDIASEAGVGTMLLTHLVPAPFNSVLESMYFSRVVRPANMKCDVIIGSDGVAAKISEGGKVSLFNCGSVRSPTPPSSAVVLSLAFLAAAMLANLSLLAFPSYLEDLPGLRRGEFPRGANYALVLAVLSVLAARMLPTANIRRMDSSKKTRRAVVLSVAGIVAGAAVLLGRR